MTRWWVNVRGCKPGSLSPAFGTEFRTYKVEAETERKAREAAIDAAHEEGGIEHVRTGQCVRDDG